MRVLVTGAAGFLGRAVVADLLAAGHHVETLNRRPVGQEVGADLRDRPAVVEAVRWAVPDAVVHLAGLGNVRESFLDPLTYFDVNVGGTISLAVALRELPPARFVFASTQAVYGPHPVAVLAEDLETRPASPYAASKRQAEQVLAGHASTGAIGAVALRFVNLAGAGDHERSRLIPRVLDAAAKGEPILVNGDGGTVRDYVNVTDVAVAIRLALATTESGTFRTYNVSTGVGASVRDVIATAEQVTGRRIAIVHGPAGTEPRRLVADPSKIRRELGWDPVRSSLVDLLADAWKEREGG